MNNVPIGIWRKFVITRKEKNIIAPIDNPIGIHALADAEIPIIAPNMTIVDKIPKYMIYWGIIQINTIQITGKNKDRQNMPRTTGYNFSRINLIDING